MNPCHHCGQPAPEGADFCCAGCRAVSEMLRAQGLGDFYRLRDRLGGGRPEGAVDGETLADGDSAYAHYDAPDFQARYVVQGGQCTLYLDGVHCAACVWVMDQLPRVLPGVVSSRLEFATQRLHLRWDPTRVSLSRIGSFLHGLGYASHPLSEADAVERRRARSDLLRLGIAFAAMGNTMLLAAGLYAGELDGSMSDTFRRYFEVWSLALGLPAITYCAWPFYRGAWAGLRSRTAHIDLPISLGLVAGFGMSVYSVVVGHGPVYFDSVNVLVFLLLLGRYFQQRGQRAALAGTELLAVLTPPVAWRREAEGERWRAVATSRLAVGDVVRVRAGDVVPADGTVLRGQSHLDLSFLTGESRPVAVGEGGLAWAGATNVADELHLRVDAAGADSRVGRMVQLAENGDQARAPLLRTVDRLSGYFVGAVLLLAALAGLYWAQHEPGRVFDVVVGLLVISCPCALGLATPVALSVGRGRAARCGTLVRSTAALERLARARRVVLDKTGTLTEGRAQVVQAEVPEGLRPLLGALEARSMHPLARAISAWGDSSEARALTLDAVKETPSEGIEGLDRATGRHVALGSPRWLGQGRFAAEVEAAAARGDTPVMVRLDGEVVGWLALGDPLRADTESALDRLRALGLELVLRSGDDQRVVDAVARRLRLHDALGAQRPEDKARDAAVGGRTAMVGDGVNDAPAMRAADVGVAVAGGAEAALQVADVYLTQRGLGAVADLFEGAHRTLHIVRRNLVFSLGYNVVFATLAVTGHISPLVAAVIMPLSGLTVVASSVFGRHHRVPEAREAATTAPSRAVMPRLARATRAPQPAIVPRG